MSGLLHGNLGFPPKVPQTDADRRHKSMVSAGTSQHVCGGSLEPSEVCVTTSGQRGQAATWPSSDDCFRPHEGNSGAGPDHAGVVGDRASHAAAGNHVPSALPLVCAHNSTYARHTTRGRSRRHLRDPAVEVHCLGCKSVDDADPPACRVCGSHCQPLKVVRRSAAWLVR